MHESSMLFLIDIGKDIWATLVKRVAKRSRGVHLSTVNFVDFKFIGMIFAKGGGIGFEGKYHSKRRPPTPREERMLGLVARFHRLYENET